MVDTPVPRRARGYSSAADEGWGPATAVQAGATTTHATMPAPAAGPARYPVPGHLPGSAAGRARERQAPARSRARLPEIAPTSSERGLPGWLAVLVLLIIAGIGGVIDMLSGTMVRGGFNIGIIVASIVAILLVRRSRMFPVVVAPPIVYSAASGAMLYLRSGGLHDKHVLFDAAQNWLVYGFPAIAGATAAVLIIAGVRLIVRR